jgi:small subunit ribosomal protein S6
MARHYDLVLMLDAEAADGDRDKLADAARKQIESAGALEHSDSWGVRKLAYEIRQRTEADYRYFRFQGESELLQQLDHSLKITDGVLRFRIFKVDPETPTAPPPTTERPAAVGSERSERPDRPDRRERGEPGGE